MVECEWFETYQMALKRKNVQRRVFLVPQLMYGAPSLTSLQPHFYTNFIRFNSNEREEYADV